MDKIGNIGSIKTGAFYTRDNWGKPDQPNIFEGGGLTGNFSPTIDFIFKNEGEIWGADDDTLVCLHVGRLAAEKNLGLAVRAFAAIAAHPPRAKLLWVGDGPQRKALQAAHPDHLFAGMRRGDDLAAHYASADLFLFPSLTETYGNVVAEAMASGLPTLAYRSAAAAELIVDGENGATVTPGDEKTFIDTARQLAADAPLRLTLGHAARTALLPRSWPHVVAQFENVAREIIAG